MDYRVRVMTVAGALVISELRQRVYLSLPVSIGPADISLDLPLRQLLQRVTAYHPTLYWRLRNSMPVSLRVFCLLAAGALVAALLLFGLSAPSPLLAASGTVVGDVAQALSLEVAAAPARRKRRRRRRRGPSINTAGQYTGTMVLSGSKSFPGFNCNPTPSFPVLVTASNQGRRVVATLNNLSKALVGNPTRTGFKISGSVKNNGIKRSFVLTASQVQAASAVMKFVETVRQGKRKACIFRHMATVARVG